MSRRNFNKKNNANINANAKGNRIRIVAKNLDLALTEAESKLHVEKSRISYEIISQTGSKLFSFLGFSKVEIDAWVDKTDLVKNSSRIETVKKKKNKSGLQKKSKKDRSSQKNDRFVSEQKLSEDQNTNEDPKVHKSLALTDQEYDLFLKDSVLFTKGLCSFLSDEEVQVSTEFRDDRLIVNIDSEDLKEMFCKTPKLYEALEHLIRKKPRFLKRELPFRIFVDSCKQRVQKEDSLVVLANDMAQKVVSTQKPIVLDYRSPADRRIIHMALDKNEFVYTKSIGSGPNRKLMILPSGEALAKSDSTSESESRG